MLENGTTHIYYRKYRDFNITATEEGVLEASGVIYACVLINSMLPQLHNEQEVIVVDPMGVEYFWNFCQLIQTLLRGIRQWV